ncbi:hypothetical protein ACUB1N_000009 [Vibrio cholerae]|uniref:hypothetical protein n=1 Tax=Vibrio TaxID=662 RepID=UPI0005FAEF3E|nr:MULTISPECIES: hypothetical protein [Vibrio]GHW76460.1 Phage protein [Vibrio metoecus]EGQ8094297.1 hypothetical protein [Vibrio cholerae]EGR0602049.1 hypothetical protein [Vibrio cholerae]EHE6924426.1 hypothetical protein [Vibrio cholerae]EJL6308140.1 hypothetical protein [Vibrio cholerae]
MDLFDIQQLAGAALGLSEEQTDEIINDDEDFDTPLMDKFGIDLDTFGCVAEALLPLTPHVSSPLTKTVYHAFVRHLGNGDCMAICKSQVKQSGATFE